MCRVRYRKIRICLPETRWDTEINFDVNSLMPCCQEKLLASQTGDRTKTDTGRKDEYSKARERNIVKELGKLAPYLREKGPSFWLKIYFVSQ